MLIELSRREEEKLTVFLNENPFEELKTPPFKKVRDMDRKSNLDSRKRPTEKAKVIRLARKLVFDLAESFEAMRAEYEDALVWGTVSNQSIRCLDI